MSWPGGAAMHWPHHWFIMYTLSLCIVNVRMHTDAEIARILTMLILGIQHPLWITYNIFSISRCYFANSKCIAWNYFYLAEWYPMWQLIKPHCICIEFVYNNGKQGAFFTLLDEKLIFLSFPLLLILFVLTVLCYRESDLLFLMKTKRLPLIKVVILTEAETGLSHLSSIHLIPYLTLFNLA